MRNKKFWIVIFVLLTVIVFAIALGAGLLYLMNLPATVEENTTLEVVLAGSVSEFPAQDPFSDLFAPQGQNIWEIRQALNAAREDSRINAVLLQVYPLGMTWAQVEELREMLAHFQESGKRVYTFLSVDILGERELYLVSGSDQIFINPTAGLLLDGLMTEVVFMKRTMDKLAVKPQFIQLKEFKSAETFTRENLSDEVRAMLEGILRELQDRFVSAIAEDRSIEPQVLFDFMSSGLGTSETAQQLGLVDQASYRSALLEMIAEDTGMTKFTSLSISDYLDTGPGKYAATKARVALVGAFGTIISGRSDQFSGLIGGSTLSSRLKELRDNDSIDGVILRVDSPGGSAVGSDMIWEEVRNLEEAGKPVVVSMSGVAASGGYYISMPARRIVCQPSTITGSIGVIFGKFDLSGLYNWLGMDIDRIKLAENADLFSSLSSLSEEQRAHIEGWMNSTYETFVRKAAEGRKMGYEELEPKAHGRIYTGFQAVEQGLADRLGGLSAAIEEMKTALNLTQEDLIQLEIFPRPKTLWELLASGDLFEVKAAASWADLVRTEFSRLEEPKVWLMAPEISIR